MIYRRWAGYGAALLVALVVPLAAFIGASYASSAHSSASDVQQLPSVSSLAPEQKADAKFFVVPKQGHHTVVGETPVRLRIPAIGVDSPIIRTTLVGGSTWQVGDWAVGFMVGSANPGTCTTWAGVHDCTTALSAHDDIKGELFRRTIDLKTGNLIFVYTKKTMFTYRVNGQFVVSPENSSNLFSTTRSVALVTCTPYWVDTSRLVTTAILIRERPLSH